MLTGSEKADADFLAGTAEDSLDVDVIQRRQSTRCQIERTAGLMQRLQRKRDQLIHLREAVVLVQKEMLPLVEANQTSGSEGEDPSEVSASRDTTVMSGDEELDEAGNEQHWLARNMARPQA